MPRGLQSVVQPFEVDDSKYNFNRMIARHVEFNAVIDGTIDKIGKLNAALGSLPDAKRISIEVSGADAAIAKVAALQKALDGLGDKKISVGGDNGEMVRHLQDISTYMDIATDSMGRMEEHLLRINKNTEDSSASLDMQTQMLRDNADAHRSAASAVAEYAAAAAAANRGGGGGGAAFAAAAGAAAGGGGGGGGAGGAFAGGLAGRIFGGATGTLAGVHMATMLTMEIASQVVPAAVAAGAAAAVGYQGGVAAYQRGQGIYTAGEALGGAYGMTPGQLFGMSPGYQIAQNQATGGVYGIIGSIMRMAGSAEQQGGILGPGGMGVQTVAMINRGLANMVGSGRMNQISGALSGGTGALQTIGDIGANLGDTLLNLAPVLPGMGGMLFGGLKAGTGLLRSVTGLAGGGGLWPLAFGTGLAAEAGYRWGGPILGGGKLPWFLGGGQFKGLAGMAERFGLGTVGDGAGIMGSGLAGALGAGVGGLPIAGLAALAAASAYGISQGQFGTPAAGAMGGYMRGINASFGAGSLTPITQALFHAGMTQANLPGVSYDTVAGQQVPVGEAIGQLRRQGYSPQQALAKVQGEYAANTQNVANQLGQMAAAGPAGLKALTDLGVKGATLTQAFDSMTMAMISPKDVGPGGKLDKTAMSQLASFIGAYSLMSAGPGAASFTAGHVRALQPSLSALASAGGADYIMASPQMKALSQVNQALDSMTQIMTGGPANASALYQAGAAAPAGMARALGQGPFTATGAAAWQAFTNPQTGIVAASQANMDQLRTFETIGGLKGPQAAQLGAFELQQSVMPYASQSPMALAMLQQQAMQAGVPGVKMGQSFAQTQKAINAHAGTMQQANTLMTRGTQAAANIPAVANFLNPDANINPLQSALYAQMAQSAITAAGHPTKGNVAALQSAMSMSGVSQGQMKVGVDAVLQQLHVPSSLIVKINGELNLPKPPVLRGSVIYTSNFTKAAAPVLHGVVIYNSLIQSAGVAGAPGVRLHGQSGFKVPGYGGGDIIPAMLEPGEAVVPKHLVPQLAPFLGANKVPGFAAGGLAGLSIFEYDTSKSIATLAQAVSSLASTLGGSGAGAPMPAAAQKVFNSYDATLPKGMWGQFASQILQGLIEGVKNAPHETAKMAQALVSQVTQAVTYGKGVAAAAKQGGGYNPWGGGSTLLGTFGNFATPTTTAQGQNYQYYTDQAAAGGGQTLSVQQQMGDYLQAMKSFQGDLSKLGKAGLNKNLMQQLIAAGPLQGDQEAQSILGGAGGAKGANSLWNQINAQANKLGVGAAGSVYGTGGKGVKIPVHADTAAAQAAINEIHGKSVVISVNVNVGGAGGGGGGGVKLSDGQIKQVTAQVQAALLKQAKRNRGTNIQLPGYAA